MLGCSGTVSFDASGGAVVSKGSDADGGTSGGVATGDIGAASAEVPKGVGTVEGVAVSTTTGDTSTRATAGGRGCEGDGGAEGVGTASGDGDLGVKEGRTHESSPLSCREISEEAGGEMRKIRDRRKKYIQYDVVSHSQYLSFKDWYIGPKNSSND